MKAKRILSLLLTVAMIATCTVTSFAVTYGDDTQGIVNETFASAYTQNINADAVKADPNILAFDVDVTQTPDDEFLSGIGCSSWTDLELDDTWGAYVIKFSLNNIGTVVKTTATGVGYTIGSANVYYVTDAANYMVMDGTTFDSEFATSCMKLNDVNGSLSPSFSSTGADMNYPLNVKSVSGNIDNFMTVNILVKDDTEFTFDGATVVYTNYKKKSIVSSDAVAKDEISGEAFVPIQYAAWAPASIKFTEAGPVVTPPEVGATIGDATSAGIVVSGEKTYDNAIKVEATIVPGDAKEFGMYFIPDWVKTGDAIDWSKAAKATVGEDAIGTGNVIVKAALISIPGKYAKETINILSKAYAKHADGTEFTGAEFTTALTFDEISK